MLRRLIITLILASFPLHSSYGVITHSLDYNKLCDDLLSGDASTAELMQGFVRLQWDIEELIREASNANEEVVSKGIQAAHNYLDLAKI